MSASTVIIMFTLGRSYPNDPTSELKEPRRFRIVVEPTCDPFGGTDIEVLTKDRRGADSWRPAKGVKIAPEHILALALLKSQMNPLQRIESPRQLHPDGLVWHDGYVTIELGRIDERVAQVSVVEPTNTGGPGGVRW